MRYSSSSSSLLATSTAVVAALFLASTHTLDAAQVTLELPDAKSSVTGLVHTASFDDEPIAAFLGLPYTEKPLGELRFRSAKVKPLSGHINATTFGAPCLQSGNADPNEFPDPEAPPPSEDCLYLNVWSPHPNATHAPQPANYPASAQSKVNGASDGNEPLLPVMVWIHGGGFGIGTGSERWFNGTELARSQHVVVVTLNYRLGPLGFLASDESDHGTGGMNGIHDIIVALQWLHLHASHFGGDSSSMTVFGQSAGGMAACILAVSPLTRGLVKNVIIESGALRCLLHLCNSTFNPCQKKRLFELCNLRARNVHLLPSTFRRSSLTPSFVAADLVMPGPCIDLAPAGWGPANEEYAANVSKQFFESVNATSLDQLRELNASLMQWPDPIANDANFPGSGNHAQIVATTVHRLVLFLLLRHFVEGSWIDGDLSRCQLSVMQVLFRWIRDARTTGRSIQAWSCSCKLSVVANSDADSDTMRKSVPAKGRSPAVSRHVFFFCWGSKCKRVCFPPN